MAFWKCVCYLLLVISAFCLTATYAAADPVSQGLVLVPNTLDFPHSTYKHILVIKSVQIILIILIIEVHLKYLKCAKTILDKMHLVASVKHCKMWNSSCDRFTATTYFQYLMFFSEVFALMWRGGR